MRKFDPDNPLLKEPKLSRYELGLLSVFYKLDSQRDWIVGFGASQASPAPIKYRSILDLQELFGENLNKFEIDLLLEVDREFISKRFEMTNRVTEKGA
jgi:hypothetical protein